jgi:hypothetical protein
MMTQDQVIQQIAQMFAPNIGNRLTDELANGILLGINNTITSFAENLKTEAEPKEVKPKK